MSRSCFVGSSWFPVSPAQNFASISTRSRPVRSTPGEIRTRALFLSRLGPDLFDRSNVRAVSSQHLF